MCGIVGYAGEKQASEILLYGLERLEYRGYDSAGICIQTENGFCVEKTKGRVSALRELIEAGKERNGFVGIGHTRWATHGAPSDINSHPHLSDSGKIAVVHNGIIENENSIRLWLLEKGHFFQSETDTEVIASLIGHYYSLCHDFPLSVRKALSRLEGSYALGILCEDFPGTLIAAKKDSPLVIGFGNREHFIASDITPILKFTREVSYLKDGDMAVLDKCDAVFYNAAGEIVQKKRETVSRHTAEAERTGYEHYMLKEIFEQPNAMRDTIRPRIAYGKVRMEELRLDCRKIRRIFLVGCGSAYYVGVYGKYLVERLCGISTEAAIASEFRYTEPIIGENDLVICISQSGETADTLAALKEAKGRGSHTLAIVNTVGSAIAMAADDVLYTMAGPEIAVASTKAFSCQLCSVMLLALHIADSLNTIPPEEYSFAVEALLHLPETIGHMLKKDYVEKIQYLADHFCSRHNAFFVGRSSDSAICLEGSLKLKEIAYLHSEAYPAGELKHGPISLIENGTLVVALATSEKLFDKTMANIREVKARGAVVLCITLEEKEQQAMSAANHVVTVPKIFPLLQSVPALLPLQLFAYYVALNRGCDVDKPRNLAKSVTVE